MDLLRRSSTFLAGLLIGLLSAGLVLLVSSEPRGVPVTLLPAATDSPLRIHVAGAVQSPGVYSLPPGSIVQEAVEAAGGVAADADLAALNLAAKLLDGMQIYIPLEGEAVPTAIAAPGLNSAGQRVQINQATARELELLPGIGPVLAASIIEHREANGPFQSEQDLLQVTGIGPAKLEAIRDLIILP